MTSRNQFPVIGKNLAYALPAMCLGVALTFQYYPTSFAISTAARKRMRGIPLTEG
jgi:hypothetical protein